MKLKLTKMITSASIAAAVIATPVITVSCQKELEQGQLPIPQENKASYEIIFNAFDKLNKNDLAENLLPKNATDVSLKEFYYDNWTVYQYGPDDADRFKKNEKNWLDIFNKQGPFWKTLTKNNLEKFFADNLKIIYQTHYNSDLDRAYFIMSLVPNEVYQKALNTDNLEELKTFEYYKNNAVTLYWDDFKIDEPKKDDTKNDLWRKIGYGVMGGAVLFIVLFILISIAVKKKKDKKLGRK
ncbi:hypothetical protein FJO69_00285 [[Mycoplasma] falconis]|uniref:Variable surface lipoprotein n=1 Tax=[Mycoplasma] falconis TaxID=92403 RepID=A0A501XC25_9BACT|nr:hypothetical protein [[Mycoplasma] falconis]TPE58036.1 hypothetical protein FJO69_00285 [[Mycoplasma] falconis]